MSRATARLTRAFVSKLSLGQRYFDISLMMAQSAMRCSCVVLSVGARGSAAGFGVVETVACCFGSAFFFDDGEAVVEIGEEGFLVTFRSEVVVVRTRRKELPFPACAGGAHGWRTCCDCRAHGHMRADCPAPMRPSRMHRDSMVVVWW